MTVQDVVASSDDYCGSCVLFLSDQFVFQLSFWVRMSFEADKNFS